MLHGNYIYAPMGLITGPNCSDGWAEDPNHPRSVVNVLTSSQKRGKMTPDEIKQMWAEARWRGDHDSALNAVGALATWLSDNWGILSGADRAILLAVGESIPV